MTRSSWHSLWRMEAEVVFVSPTGAPRAERNFLATRAACITSAIRMCSSFGMIASRSGRTEMPGRPSALAPVVVANRSQGNALAGRTAQPTPLAPVAARYSPQGPLIQLAPPTPLVSFVGGALYGQLEWDFQYSALNPVDLLHSLLPFATEPGPHLLMTTGLGPAARTFAFPLITCQLDLPVLPMSRGGKCRYPRT